MRRTYRHRNPEPSMFFLFYLGLLAFLTLMLVVMRLWFGL